jgi:hypothetical protein
MDDDAPLNASWLLYYLEGRATLLHNITFLRDGDIHAGEIDLVARAKQETALRLRACRKPWSGSGGAG